MTEVAMLALPRYAGPRPITPPGQALQVWGPRIAEADTVTVPALLSRLNRLGGARRSGSGRDLDPGVAPPLVVLGAHPDDETLGCGRLMHCWSRRASVSALVATAGEACVDHVSARPGDLAGRRLQEWHAALDTLGVDGRACLGLPDGRVADAEDVLVHRLRRWLAERVDQRPGAPVVIAAPWRHDPHPDHRACGRAAARVAAEDDVLLIEFPVWMTYWSDPESDEAASMSLLRLAPDVAADLAHRQACSAFATQLTPLADDLEPVVPPSALRHHSQQLVILTQGAG